MAETVGLESGLITNNLKRHTGERGSAVSAARSCGIMLILGELADGEGRLVGVTESGRLISFTFC